MFDEYILHFLCVLDLVRESIKCLLAGYYSAFASAIGSLLVVGCLFEERDDGLDDSFGGAHGLCNKTLLKVI